MAMNGDPREIISQEGEEKEIELSNELLVTDRAARASAEKAADIIGSVKNIEESGRTTEEEKASGVETSHDIEKIGQEQKAKDADLGEVLKDRNYYEFLGVSPDATFEEIKNAFREKAKQYHPDLNLENQQAEDRFKKINEAYETLSDNEKRKRYDAGLKDKPKEKLIEQKQQQDKNAEENKERQGEQEGQEERETRMRREQEALLTPFEKFTEAVYYKAIIPLRYFKNRGWKRLLGVETIGSAQKTYKKYEEMARNGDAEFMHEESFPNEVLYKEARRSDWAKHYTNAQGRKFRFRLVGDYNKDGAFAGTARLYRIYEK